MIKNIEKCCFISARNYVRKIFSKPLIDFEIMSIVRLMNHPVVICLIIIYIAHINMR